MDVYNIIREAHSGIRWLVLLVVVLTLVKLLITWLGKKKFSKGDSKLTRATIGLLDVQFLLGLSLLLYYILNSLPLASFYYEHAGTNLIAIFVAHIAGKGRNKPGPIRARNTFFLFLLALLLIAVAITRLPQGWG